MKTIQKPETEIRALKNKLIETLQDYSRSQVELWQQVPALAREADISKLKEGRTLGRYQIAYYCNYWPISSTDIHWLWVRLKTGKLGSDQLLNRIRLDQLDSILQALDANEVIKLLKSEIKSLSKTAQT